MRLRWGQFAQHSGMYLKTGWLISAALVAVYVGWIKPLNSMRGISQERGTGLAIVDSARVGWAPEALLQRGSTMIVARGIASGIVGGVPGGVQEAEIMPNLASAVSPSLTPPLEGTEDRKTVQTASLDVIVTSPAPAAEDIRKLAERLGGYLENSQVSDSPNAFAASIAIRVPSPRFEEAHTEIRKLALRVDEDRITARDTTKQYVDLHARLRNLLAEEGQYQSILKQAKTVKDTLEVSEKLSGVRGEIEQQQAEFDVLSKQIETVAINVALHAEVDAQVLGLSWRPLLQLKVGASAGLQGLADYAESITYFLFYLPTILLWLMTILLGAAAGCRILRWGARLFFAPRPIVTAAEPNASIPSV
jgi:Domain of unknown function (DUF4349)